MQNEIENALWMMTADWALAQGFTWEVENTIEVRKGGELIADGEIEQVLPALGLSYETDGDEIRLLRGSEVVSREGR